MAGKNNKGVNIGVGLDTSGIASGVQQVQGQMAQLNKEVRSMVGQLKGTTQEAAQGFKKVGDSSGIAGAAVMSFNGIIQDSNYGIRGIANNLQQFTVMMIGLVSQTKSVKLAFVELRNVLLGPLGILLAITSFITYLERQGMQTKKTVEDNKKLTNSFLEEKVEIDALTSIIKNNGTERETQINAYKRLQELVPDLSKLTLDEAVSTDALTVSVKKLIEHKLKLFEVEKRIKEISDLQGKYDEAAENRNKLVKEEVSFLEKLGNFFTSTEGGDVFYSNVNEAATRVTNRLESMNSEIQRKKEDLASIMADGGITEAKEIKPKRIEVDTSAFKDIASGFDFDARTAAIKETLKQMQDVVAEGGDLMAFDGKLLGVKFGAGVTDGLDQLMTTLPDKMSTVVKAIVEPIDEINMRLNAMVKQMIVSSVSGFLGAVGESIGGGKDAIKKFGEDFLGEFGGFLQQVGTMILTYGFAMEAFKKAFTNPVVAIAAGAALILLGGAIKDAHEK